MLKLLELEFPRGWGESKGYVHGPLHGEPSPQRAGDGKQEVAGDSYGGQSENHSATPSSGISSEEGQGKIHSRGSRPLRSGPWRFRGNTAGQELWEVDEAPSSQGPGETQLEKGEQGEEGTNDHHTWASHQTLAGPL